MIRQNCVKRKTFCFAMMPLVWNPITGGGIINAMIAGKLAAETACEALKKGKTGESSLKVYAKRCDKRIGKMNRRFYRLKEGIFSIATSTLLQYLPRRHTHYEPDRRDG